MCAALWERESAHFRSRCGVLLGHMRAAHGGRFREDSHVFSYYFVKASLFSADNRVAWLRFLESARVFICFRRPVVHAFLALVRSCIGDAQMSAKGDTDRSLSMTSIKTEDWLAASAPKAI
jgi:hypothetical protein